MTVGRAIVKHTEHLINNEKPIKGKDFNFADHHLVNTHNRHAALTISDYTTSDEPSNEPSTSQFKKPKHTRRLKEDHNKQKQDLITKNQFEPLSTDDEEHEEIHRQHNN